MTEKKIMTFMGYDLVITQKGNLFVSRNGNRLERVASKQHFMKVVIKLSAL